MADDVIRASTPETQATVAAPAVPARTPSRAERARRTVYRGRFALLYLLLAAVAGAAVGATIVLGAAASLAGIAIAARIGRRP